MEDSKKAEEAGAANATEVEKVDDQATNQQTEHENVAQFVKLVTKLENLCYSFATILIFFSLCAFVHTCT